MLCPCLYRASFEVLPLPDALVDLHDDHRTQVAIVVLDSESVRPGREIADRRKGRRRMIKKAIYRDRTIYPYAHAIVRSRADGVITGVRNVLD